MAVFGLQLLLIHTLSKLALVNSFESAPSKKSHNCIKTMGFKPRRITHFPHAVSQLLWNHTLSKNRVGGSASPTSDFRPPTSNVRCATDHGSRFIQSPRRGAHNDAAKRSTSR